MKDFEKFFPWIIVGVGGVYLTAGMFTPSVGKDQMPLDICGSQPVVDRGRIKRFDTLARTSLMIISGKQTFRFAFNKEEQGQNNHQKGQTFSAVKWLLDVMSGRPNLETPVGNKLEVFRIESLQVMAFLGLPPRPGWFRYSIAELADKIDDIILERKRIENLDPKKLGLYEHKIIELSDHLRIYLDIAHWKTPFAVPPLAGGGPDNWKPLLQGLQDQANVAVAMRVMFNAYAEGDQETFTTHDDACQQALYSAIPHTIDAPRF